MCLVMLNALQDMTFRDYAQGSFRMRGIAQGQKIHLFIIPEVARLITTHIKVLCFVHRVRTHSRMTCQASGRTPAQPTDVPGVLRDVSAWLVVNSMKTEKVQFNMLCEQNIQNVWRKNAFRALLAHNNKVAPMAAVVATRVH